MNRLSRTVMAIGSLALAVTLILSAPLQADDIQARMKARVPQIVALKAKGIVGENHKGFLEFVGNSREGADILKAENADRKTVYAALAKKTGATPSQVGARAALKWKKNLGKGEYFKNADGKWIRK